jgi:hypothetical protein
MINPAFIQFPQEAALLGQMVIGYGELDLTFAHNCGMVISHQYAVLEACHSVRSESARLDIANALGFEAFHQTGLGAEYDLAHRAMRYCLKVRNLYSHVHWGDMNGILCPANAEAAFSRPLKPVKWVPVYLEHLQEQEAYFEYTRKWLLWLQLTLGERGKRSPAT